MGSCYYGCVDDDGALSTRFFNPRGQVRLWFQGIFLQTAEKGSKSYGRLPSCLALAVVMAFLQKLLRSALLKREAFLAGLKDATEKKVNLGFVWSCIMYLKHCLGFQVGVEHRVGPSFNSNIRASRKTIVTFFFARPRDHKLRF